MNRSELIKRKGRMEALYAQVSFYNQIPGTPKILYQRTREEIANQWSIIRALVGIRHHIRNKNKQGKQLASKLKNTEQFEPIAKAIDKEVQR